MSNKQTPDTADLGVGHPSKFQSSHEIFTSLYDIMCKLYGIGELIKYYNGEPAINQDQINLGIGQLVTDLAHELADIRDELESRDYQPTRDVPDTWHGDQDSPESQRAVAPTYQDKLVQRDPSELKNVNNKEEEED